MDAGQKVNFGFYPQGAQQKKSEEWHHQGFEKHVKLEVKWHARHATADLLSYSERVSRLRRSGRVASCCDPIIRNARQVLADVTLPLVIHGELFGAPFVPTFTNWKPGSIFLVTKQSSVSGHPQIWF